MCNIYTKEEQLFLCTSSGCVKLDEVYVESIVTSLIWSINIFKESSEAIGFHLWSTKVNIYTYMKMKNKNKIIYNIYSLVSC
jgi:hypothetical protein